MRTIRKVTWAYSIFGRHWNGWSSGVCVAEIDLKCGESGHYYTVGLRNGPTQVLPDRFQTLAEAKAAAESALVGEVKR